MNIIPVTAAVIFKDNTVLLAQRSKGDPLEDLWEFPGGKIIPGESPEQCLVREIDEELAMEVQVEDIFQVVSHSYSQGKNIFLLAYLCRHLQGEGQARECQDYRWVPLDRLYDYPMPEADWPIRDKIIRKLTRINR